MIEGCQAVPMNGRSLGLGLLGFVQLGLGEHDPDVSAGMERIVSECPTMLSCRNTTGEADFLLRVAGKDLDGRTAAMRLGLAKQPLTYEDVLWPGETAPGPRRVRRKGRRLSRLRNARHATC